MGSSTRKLAWDDAARVEPFGLDSAYFTIPKGRGDGEDARWFNAPGGRSVFLRPDPQGTTRVVLSVQQDPQGWDDLSPEDQKRVLIDRFADAGWETPRVLEGLRATADFYFHSLGLVKVDRFHKGRVALTGDAAWAVMGRGTTLALVGPYVLAGELARTGDVAAALEGYERVMRPFVDVAQDVPSWGPKALQPQTRRGIGLQHAMLKLIAAPGARAVTGRFAAAGDDLPPLPDYPELLTPAQQRAAVSDSAAAQQSGTAVRRSINWAGWLLAAGGGALAVAGLRRAGRLAAVPPELRSPALLVPMTTSPGSLPVFRMLQASAPKPATPAGVRMVEHRLPSGGGGPGVRVLTFERSTSKGTRPALLWLHGGGYVMGMPEQDMALVGRILDRLDVLIVSVDYRLAPEHPFPAALDDAHAAYAWLAGHAAELSVDPARIAVGGQSAGGGLAATLVQRAVDQGPVRPAFQLLMYPMLDASTTRRDEFGRKGEFVWTPASNRFGWQSYLGGRDPEQDGFPAYAVPAARADLINLPSAWIGVGTLDLFHDEDIAYGRRLVEAGIACDVHAVEGGYHAFDLFRPDAAASRSFQDAMIRALGGGLELAT